MLEHEKLLSLKKKYGTPLFIYDSQKIIEQYNKLITAFNNEIKIKYACKALTNINILSLMKQMGVGLDTVSIEEIQLGIYAGFKPEEIIFTPSVPSFEEIKKAIELGVQTTIDDLVNLEKFGKEYGNNIPIAIRINPNVLAGGNHKISTGHKDAKFGFDVDQIEKVIELEKKYNLNIVGLHMHTGSDIDDVDSFLQSGEVLFNVAKKFNNLKFLDMGSGFKVKYFKDDKETDLKLLSSKLLNRFKDFSKEYGTKLELFFEPGKFLVSKAGYFLVEVNTIKENNNKTFVGVNSGLNHLIRPMFYDAYHEIENISNNSGDKERYTVVGYICETDTIGENRLLNKVNIGDILCIQNAGAYCFSMSSNYNSRLRPAEILIHEGKDYLIRERETFKDLIKHQKKII
jgi:diaminopimelate decarboxylase